MESEYCTCGGRCNREGFCRECGKPSKLTAKSYEEFRRAVLIEAEKKKSANQMDDLAIGDNHPYFPVGVGQSEGT